MINLSGGPFHRKILLRVDLLLEIDIRIVSESQDYPEGIRYRCYLGNPRTHETIILYDIHPGKPHHRHIRGREERYLFRGPEELWSDFMANVEAVLRGDV